MRVLSLLILTAVTAIANAAVIGEMRPAIPLAKDVEGKTPTRASSMQTRAAMEVRKVLEARERNNCNQFCWKDSECLGRCSYCNPDYGKCLGMLTLFLSLLFAFGFSRAEEEIRCRCA